MTKAFIVEFLSSDAVLNTLLNLDGQYSSTHRTQNTLSKKTAKWRPLSPFYTHRFLGSCCWPKYMSRVLREWKILVNRFSYLKYMYINTYLYAVNCIQYFGKYYYHYIYYLGCLEDWQKRLWPRPSSSTF